jgi:hypothetical protein
MSIVVLHSSMPKSELRLMAADQFGDFVKAVVDIELEILAIGGDMHADEEALLLDNGSAQMNLWGINLYPDLPADQWIEFDSMINVRPSAGNRSRDVESPAIREKIQAIVTKLIQE